MFKTFNNKQDYLNNLKKNIFEEGILTSDSDKTYAFSQLSNYTDKIVSLSKSFNKRKELDDDSEDDIFIKMIDYIVEVVIKLNTKGLSESIRVTIGAGMTGVLNDMCNEAGEAYKVLVSQAHKKLLKTMMT